MQNIGFLPGENFLRQEVFFLWAARSNCKLFIYGARRSLAPSQKSFWRPHFCRNCRFMKPFVIAWFFVCLFVFWILGINEIPTWANRIGLLKCISVTIHASRNRARFLPLQWETKLNCVTEIVCPSLSLLSCWTRVAGVTKVWMVRAGWLFQLQNVKWTGRRTVGLRGETGQKQDSVSSVLPGCRRLATGCWWAGVWARCSAAPA